MPEQYKSVPVQPPVNLDWRREMTEHELCEHLGLRPHAPEEPIRIGNVEILPTPPDWWQFTNCWQFTK